MINETELLDEYTRTLFVSSDGGVPFEVVDEDTEQRYTTSNTINTQLSQVNKYNLSEGLRSQQIDFSEKIYCLIEFDQICALIKNFMRRNGNFLKLRYFSNSIKPLKIFGMLTSAK